VRWRQTTLNPWFRSLAGFALLVFLAAQSLCFLHCHSGASTETAGADDALPPCHRAAKSQHADPSAPLPMSNEACSTLKTMQLGDETPTVAAPTLHTMWLLAPLIVSLDDLISIPSTSLPRRDWPDDWLFTPEVSLGPAFRSLAPPLLRLS